MRSASPPLRAIVVVLGDLGASPRMLYHAMALADEGYDVTLLGYAGHTLPREVLGREKVRVRYLQSPPARRNGAAGLIVQALWRSLVQPLELLRRIVAATPAELVLVQVPPAIPNLLVTALAGRACGCRVVVDWHNFGWSMLALRAGVAGAAVAAARVYERSVATLAHAHLCVSSAMRDVLVGEWKLSPVAVLYDKPAAVFLAAAPSDLHPLRKFLHHVAGPGSDRAALTAITSTSWTADEDMDLLLQALVRLDADLATGAGTGHDGSALELIVTGDGAARAGWERRAAAAQLRHVSIRTGWLELEQYARLLASCDLGLSLHRSSSGVDLPMKILDMHGAGLAVAALDYGECLHEVLTADEESLTFRSEGELSLLLRDLCSRVEEASKRHAAATAAVRASSGESWHEQWRANALAMMREE